MSKNEIKTLAKEITKPIKKKFPRKQVITHFPAELYACDLMDFGEDKKDNGYRFALVTIDAYSRYVFAKPTTKFADEMSKNIKEVIESSILIPSSVWTDRGSEFYNSQVKQVFDSYAINHYSTGGESKAAPVERVIRTLKKKLKEKFIEEGSHEWTVFLPEIVEEYNNTKHSATGSTPWETYTFQKSHKEKERKIPKQKQKFKPGDKVRVSMVKGIFQKESALGNWSYEVFEVERLVSDKPLRYVVKDWQGETINGTFYQEELQKTEVPNTFLVDEVLETRTRNGKQESLVSWFGHGKAFNEWIPSTEVKSLKKK